LGFLGACYITGGSLLTLVRLKTKSNTPLP
jgi:hypothetical protein